ncbi:hypothetical protein GOP47_0005483 [Adiantum capillus-veneris]|uniref:Uncharacterized protein n=1 Tax=Adiantum capillus-veneris TaxID=13818 RepID=A0A9D4ZLM1_ADICA|nr:hypothetical protein GOP47_0005483 [Adiantum capillus-veneris]
MEAHRHAGWQLDRRYNVQRRRAGVHHQHLRKPRPLIMHIAEKVAIILFQLLPYILTLPRHKKWLPSYALFSILPPRHHRLPPAKAQIHLHHSCELRKIPIC